MEDNSETSMESCKESIKYLRVSTVRKKTTTKLTIDSYLFDIIRFFVA